MNAFDEQIAPSLRRMVLEWVENERLKRDRLQSISSHESSINWIKKQLNEKKLSRRNIAEYNHQIRYHEINLAFLNYDKD